MAIPTLFVQKKLHTNVPYQVIEAHTLSKYKENSTNAFNTQSYGETGRK